MKAYLNPSQDRGEIFILFDCSEWCGLETFRALHVPTLLVLFHYFNWVFVCSFRQLIFTVVRSYFAVSAAVQLLRDATDGVFGSFPTNDCLRPEKLLLVALHPSAISLNDFIEIKERAYDYSYDLAAVIMA